MAALPPYNPNKHPFGTETSGLLTELRTVLSRAENALNEHGTWRGGDRESARAQAVRDHGNDGHRMVADLVAVIDLLDRYRKTRQAPKGDADDVAEA